MKIRKPNLLHKGDTIAFVAPCYQLAMADADKARETLEGLGFCVKYAPNLFSHDWGYAGSARQRADDFNAMIADDAVKMVLFTGGEASVEILGMLDYGLIRKKRKIIASYSDATNLLNAISLRSGLVTFYGTGIDSFIDPVQYNVDTFLARFTEGSLDYKEAAPWRVIYPGKAEGSLIGGYLGNFALAPGSRYFWLNPEEKYLLFLEDHEMFHEPAAVSRYLTALEQDGVFDHAEGLIFGHYSDDPSPLVDDILRRIGDLYRIPVVRTEDFGHGLNHGILPIGTRAKLKADTEAHFRFVKPYIRDRKKEGTAADKQDTQAGTLENAVMQEAED